MLADMSKRVVSDFARFRSPQITSAQCMTFYYHIFGHGGTMNIYQANGDNVGVPLWTRTGSQGDVWRFGRMSIDRANNYIVFEGKQTVDLIELTSSNSISAVAGANSVGDIAIDDVFFTAGACKECAAVGESCTFTDYAQCGFQQNPAESTLVWTTYSGSSLNTRVAPIPYDHTTGTSAGAYVGINLENQIELINGRLYSPMYPPKMNSSYCLEFYYVMIGSNNSFNVLTATNTGTRRFIFSRNYDHGAQWFKGETTITPVNPFQIVLEVISGYFRQGKKTISIQFIDRTLVFRLRRCRRLFDSRRRMRLPRRRMHIRRRIVVRMDQCENQ